MFNVTNRSQGTQTFRVKGAGKGGVPKYESVRPGETKALDLYDRKGGYAASQERTGAAVITEGKAAAEPERKA